MDCTGNGVFRELRLSKGRIDVLKETNPVAVGPGVDPIKITQFCHAQHARHGTQHKYTRRTQYPEKYIRHGDDVESWFRFTYHGCSV